MNGFTEEEEFEFALAQEQENQNLSAQTPSTRAQLASPVPYNSQLGFAGKAVNLMRSAIKPMADVTLPLTNPSASKLEDLGKMVGKSVQSGSDRIAELGFPAIATATSMAGEMGELTPTNLAIGAGSEALPVITTPLARRAEILRRSVGNKFIGTPLPSLKRSFRQGTETLGEKFLNTDLPANREEAFVESSNMVDQFESKIQSVLNRKAKAGKMADPIVPNDEFSAMQSKLAEPIVLPSGGAPNRFSDPAVGTIPRYNPEELNLQTHGKKFTKGESRGLFNPESSEIQAKQIAYLKQQREGDILKAREAFQKRMEDPEYGFGIKQEYAIGRDTIADAIQKVSDQAKKSGLENDSVRAIADLKTDFIESHPKFADIHYWNDIKRSLHKKVGDKGYLAKNTTEKVDVLKKVAQAIRKEIERVVPEIKDLNKEQGLYLEIRNSLGDTLATRSKNNVAGVVKGELQDEALVRAARKKLGQHAYKTRGVSGLALPMISNDD